VAALKIAGMKLLVSCAFLLLVSLPAFATGLLPNFHDVGGGIYRSGRPLAGAMPYLRELGVRTVVSLEEYPAHNAAEGLEAEAAGLRHISIPFHGFLTPTDAQVNEALAVIQDPANQPVLIHCYYGADRTGLIIGLLRVETQGWAPDAAFLEMREKGFSVFQALIKAYFVRRTGWR
jgi:tyrosine-protein phosphatase SIW14